MKTGIHKLDDILKGGVKEHNSVLFCSDPGVSNQEFAQQLPFSARFKGEIYFNQTSVQKIESDLKDVGVGETVELITTFTPKEKGTYIIKGYIEYANRKTDVSESFVNVSSEDYLPLSLSPLIIILFLLVVYMVVQKKRAKKNRNSKRKK